MAITILTGAGNVTVNGSGTAGNTMTGNKPSNTANGDLLLAFVHNRNGDALTTVPTGWTQFGIEMENNAITSSWPCWHRVTDAASEPASWDWVKIGTGAKWIVMIARALGVDATDPEDAVGTNAATTGTTSITIPGMTTVAANAMLIGAAGAPRGNVTAPVFSVPTGMTEIGTHDVNDGASSLRATCWYEARPTAGTTGDRVSTITNTAAHSIGHLFSLLPASEDSVLQAAQPFPAF